MGMSYKKAWNMINNLNSQWNEPMVITQSCGEGGGGSSLTKAALELITHHTAMRKRLSPFLAMEKEKLIHLYNVFYKMIKWIYLLSLYFTRYNDKLKNLLR